LEPQAQALVWFAASVLMCWGCYVECVRAGDVLLAGQPVRGMFGRIPTWLGYAGLLAATFPALNCLQRGQVGVAKLYLLLLGFRLLIESRSRARAFLAGVVLATPIVLKLTPLVPVAFLLAHQGIARRKSADRTAAPRVGACWLGTASGLVLFV